MVNFFINPPAEFSFNLSAMIAFTASVWIMSLMTMWVLRDSIYKLAFFTYGKKLRKATLKRMPLRKKIMLRFTLDYNAPYEVRRKLRVYYVFLFSALSLNIIIVLRPFFHFLHWGSLPLFYFWIGFQLYTWLRFDRKRKRK